MEGSPPISVHAAPSALLPFDSDAQVNRISRFVHVSLYAGGGAQRAVATASSNGRHASDGPESCARQAGPVNDVVQTHRPSTQLPCGELQVASASQLAPPGVTGCNTSVSLGLL
eukprot:1096189-Prymnesium_polylepis.2